MPHYHVYSTPPDPSTWIGVYAVDAHGRCNVDACSRPFWTPTAGRGPTPVYADLRAVVAAGLWVDALTTRPPTSILGDPGLESTEDPDEHAWILRGHLWVWRRRAATGHWTPVEHYSGATAALLHVAACRGHVPPSPSRPRAAPAPDPDPDPDMGLRPRLEAAVRREEAAAATLREAEGLARAARAGSHDAIQHLLDLLDASSRP